MRRVLVGSVAYGRTLSVPSRASDAGPDDRVVVDGDDGDAAYDNYVEDQILEGGE